MECTPRGVYPSTQVVVVGWLVGTTVGSLTGLGQCPFAESCIDCQLKEPRGLLGAIDEGGSGCGIAPCLSRR